VTTGAPAVLPLPSEKEARAATAPPLERDFALREEHEEPRHSDGGGLTLGELFAGVWEGLHAAGAAGCPVCGERMRRVGEVGRCGGCGSTLS
jgi:hypothetical protein